MFIRALRLTQCMHGPVLSLVIEGMLSVPMDEPEFVQVLEQKRGRSRSHSLVFTPYCLSSPSLLISFMQLGLSSRFST